jgi:tetratricopeptide (TPR) repeat protein
MYRIEESIDNYSKELQYIPDNAKKGIAYFNIANNYMRLNKFDDAITRYQLAIEMDNSLFASSALGLSRAYILKGNMVQAISYYKKARERLYESEMRLREAQDANKGGIYLIAAGIAYQLGYNDDALKYAEKGQDIRNTDLARLTYAGYLARLGNKKKAVREGELVNIDNCSAGTLALFYLLIDDNEKAIKYFNISHAELKTPEQIKVWNLSLNRDAMYPHDDWAKARNQEWFKSKILK